MRALDAEHLPAGVGVGVEVHHADRPVDGRARAHRRLGDRVVAAEHDRQHARRQHLADRRLDRGVRGAGVGGDHRRVAEVDDPQLRERVDLDLEVRAGRRARAADRARRQRAPGRSDTRSSIGAPTIADVEALELGGVLGERRAAERQQPA